MDLYSFLVSLPPSYCVHEFPLLMLRTDFEFFLNPLDSGLVNFPLVCALAVSLIESYVVEKVTVSYI